MKIMEAILNRAIEAIGGRDSRAYMEPRICKKVVVDIAKQVEREFGVDDISKIDDLTDIVFALSVIDDYELPTVLINEIQRINHAAGHSL